MLHTSTSVEFNKSPHGFRSQVSGRPGEEKQCRGRAQGAPGQRSTPLRDGSPRGTAVLAVLPTREQNKPQEESQSLTGHPENENAPEVRRLRSKRVVLGV